MHFHSLRLNGNPTTIREAMSKAGKGDKISCNIRDGRLLSIFHEMESRGAAVFPPLLSQSLSMSKVHQALHYADYMIPHTEVLFKRTNVRKILRTYDENNISKTVVKEDHESMGLGDYPCWSLNQLAQTIASAVKPPVVVQPMLEDFREFRLVICGEVIVAKEKVNSANIFWKNRMFGGTTKMIDPSEEIVEFGKKMAGYGRFPWAYMDLLVTEDDVFLSEINLSGSNMGLREYRLNKLKRDMTEDWIRDR